jgi:CRP-like cAMP-binding protein
MTTGSLGKTFQDGEIIIKQGEKGDCMYVIQEGQAEIIREKDGKEIRIGVVDVDAFIGEMAIFESEERSATVKAIGEVRVLTIDKKNFMKRVHEDPSIAYRLVKNLTDRLKELHGEIDRYLEEGSLSHTVRVQFPEDLKPPS